MPKMISIVASPSFGNKAVLGHFSNGWKEWGIRNSTIYLGHSNFFITFAPDNLRLI